jgi:hypothetical protein
LATQTIPISGYVQWNGVLQVPFNVDISGQHVDSAALAGEWDGTLYGAGNAGFTIKLNGTAIYTDPNQLLVLGLTSFSETPSGIDLSGFLRNGANTLEFDIVQAFGEIGTADQGVSFVLTVATSTYVCTEGAVQNIQYCPDGVTWKYWEVCQNNMWVPQTATCPPPGGGGGGGGGDLGLILLAGVGVAVVGVAGYYAVRHKLPALRRPRK